MGLSLGNCLLFWDVYDGYVGGYVQRCTPIDLHVELDTSGYIDAWVRAVRPNILDPNRRITTGS